MPAKRPELNSRRGNGGADLGTYTRAVSVTPAAAPKRVTTSPVGELLRHWRGVRRLSQMALALAAGTTSRYLSFIESGRSQPSREMVLRLARVLDVPLRERNQLRLAAGYAPSYRETGLDHDEAAQVRRALERMLSSHEPYPAVVMDRHWNVITTDDAARAFFARLMGDREPDQPANVIRLMFDPAGIRPYVTNWEAVADGLVQRVHRDAVGGVPDPATVALLEEALAYPGVPEEWSVPDFSKPPLPVLPIVFEKDRLALSYFSTVTTLGTPQDAMLQEIRLESFFPADEITIAHAWQAPGGGRDTAA
jgi:transcriptional regulator with XRE-family HTH domain